MHRPARGLVGLRRRLYVTSAGGGTGFCVCAIVAFHLRGWRGERGGRKGAAEDLAWKGRSLDPILAMPALLCWSPPPMTSARARTTLCRPVTSAGQNSTRRLVRCCFHPGAPTAQASGYVSSRLSPSPTPPDSRFLLPSCQGNAGLRGTGLRADTDIGARVRCRRLR